MFSNSAGILRHFHGKNLDTCVAATDVCFQSIRWARKPLWLPVAKSKLFRIPVRPVIPKGEADELLRLHNNYKTQMKAVRFFLTQEYIISKNSLNNMGSDRSIEAELDEFNNRMLENESWNKRVAIIRENRVAEAIKSREVITLRLMENAIIKKEMEAQKTKDTIKQFEEDSKTFITKDNIDEAIEYAMSNYVDYNYAIDLDGNIIAGRETGPPQVNKSKQEIQS